MLRHRPQQFSSIYHPNNTPPKSKSSSFQKNATPSPSFLIKREMVMNVPKIDRLRNVNKITLTDDGIRKIHEKLEIDKQS